MFPKYPYLDLSDRNLDFLTKAIREMENEVKNFVTLNAVKYANPIQWSINRQYEKNTIVIDPLTGTAFISVQPVPSGVALTRTQYWTPVFDLSQFVTKAASNFANTYERDITTTATMPTGAGDWVVWDSTLYVALTSIHAGDAYVVNGNIKRMTVEDFYDLLMQAIHSLDEELDTEIRNRTDADTALQGNIDAEAQARQDADTTLQRNINSEAQARTEQDQSLSGRIDDVHEFAEYINRRVDDEGNSRYQADENIIRITEGLDARIDENEILRSFVENVENIKGKKICVIGDSISAGNNWVNVLQSYVNGYCTIDNYSQSGKTWNNASDASNPCPSSIIPNLSTTYDIFVIFLGVNDFLNGCAFGNIMSASSANTFNGAITATYNAILAHNSAAKVFCITPTATRYNPSPNPYSAGLEMYRMMIYAHCVHYGWNYIDAYSNAPLINITKITEGIVAYPWLIDGLHFNPIYYPYFAHYILNALVTDTNDCIGYRYYTSTIIKSGFDYLQYSYDTNGMGHIKLKAGLSNVIAGNMYTLLNDMPSWFDAFDSTLTGSVNEISGSAVIPHPAIIKANGQTIYFMCANSFTTGTIEMDCDLRTGNLTFFEDFSW